MAEADALFIWNHSENDEGELVEAVTSDPLFQRLDAVRAGRVHEVGTHWIQETVTGASLMLDDLRAALV
jgi:ABC-type Fe3+-hydroxamate transport system substrate-binding protein